MRPTEKNPRHFFLFGGYTPPLFPLSPRVLGPSTTSPPPPHERRVGLGVCIALGVRWRGRTLRVCGEEGAGRTWPLAAASVAPNCSGCGHDTHRTHCCCHGQVQSLSLPPPPLSAPRPPPLLLPPPLHQPPMPLPLPLPLLPPQGKGPCHCHDCHRRCQPLPFSPRLPLPEALWPPLPALPGCGAREGLGVCRGEAGGGPTDTRPVGQGAGFQIFWGGRGGRYRPLAGPPPERLWLLHVCTSGRQHKSAESELARQWPRTPSVPFCHKA